MNDQLLDSLLREADPATGLSISRSEHVSEQVRHRHARILRRRRVVRGVAGAMGCYTVGMLTMWFWMRSPANPEGDTERLEPMAVAEAGFPNPAEEVSDEPDSSRSAEQSPAAVLATRAGSPYQALRALGDRYLLQQGKVDLAVDVYSRALEQATQSESTISYEHDSWLLISLKRDRLISAL